MLEDIRLELIKASNSYYNKNVSIISDAEFDALRDKLKNLSPEDPVLKTIGSPIANTKWKKAAHTIPMGSLEKVNTTEEFSDWTKKTSENIDIVGIEKLDGISIEIIYEQGKLVQAITRGDGYEGEDITTNVLKMQNVRPEIDNWTGSVRGEILLTQSDFNFLQMIGDVLNEDAVSNMRNGASGIAKREDGKYCEYLTVQFYDCTGDFKYENEKLAYLGDTLGLEVAEWKWFVNIKEINEWYVNYQKIRPDLNHQIDGLVFRINKTELQEELGSKDLLPKWAIAWKFPSMKVKGIVEDVVWQLGRSGRITPVAVFEPINMGGVTIQRASLSNHELFLAWKLFPGCNVIVERCNDVIPGIVVNLDIDKKGNYFKAPDFCPACGEKTIIIGKFLECSNDSCQGKAIGNLKKYADKIFEDEKGLGGKTIDLLYENNLIKTPADFYKLSTENLEKLEGFGKRKAEIVYKVINANKNISLSKFIGALNLSNFGERMGELLVNSGFNTLESIRNICKAELLAIKGIEETTAESFLKSIAGKKDIIEDLLYHISISTPKKEVIMSGKFTGLSFCFTGAIQKTDAEGKRFTRGMMEVLVKENGGTVNAVKSGLTYLVQADPSSQSSKSKKAKELGVEILAEDKFFEMIEI